MVESGQDPGSSVLFPDSVFFSGGNTGLAFAYYVHLDTVYGWWCTMVMLVSRTPCPRTRLASVVLGGWQHVYLVRLASWTGCWSGVS